SDLLFLEARKNLAAKAALDGVGFQDDERAFHGLFSVNWGRVYMRSGDERQLMRMDAFGAVQGERKFQTSDFRLKTYLPEVPSAKGPENYLGFPCFGVAGGTAAPSCLGRRCLLKKSTTTGRKSRGRGL